MANINKVVLSGHLGRDGELRTTQSGLAVLTFSLAVNESVKNRATGEYENYTNWFECTMFGKAAEGIATYMTQGRAIVVEGKLRYSSWTNDDGQKRSKVTVSVNSVDLGMSGQDNSLQGKEDIPALGHGVQENKQDRWQGQTTNTPTADVKRETLPPSEKIAQASARATSFNERSIQNPVEQAQMFGQNENLASEDIPF